MRISDWSSDVCSSDLMMQWRHAEDAFATAVFEVADLQCDRYRLGDEDAAHDRQHEFLPDQHGDNAECGTERERADIAHEHLRRIRVEPEKAKAPNRSEERRVGNECVSTGRSRGYPRQ